MTPLPTATIARVRDVLAATSARGAEDTLPALLTSIADAAADLLGLRTVLIFVYRHACDDFAVLAAHAGDGTRAALLETSFERERCDALLDERFERGDAVVVPASALDWGSTFPGGDAAVLVPLRRSDGQLIGVLAGDGEPADVGLGLLTALAAHAARAVEATQAAAEAVRHRVALEQLLRISSRLIETTCADEILRGVCEGIRATLEFEHVDALIREHGSGVLRRRAGIGRELDPDFSIGMDRLWPLFDPAFEREGCFLLPGDEAVARLHEGPTFWRASSRNGHGPFGWNDHWLLVPLYDREGEVGGLIVAGEPQDRLLPSTERLQALRVLANQATTALDSAARYEEVRFLAEHDPLTGLPNRTLFHDRVDQALLAAEREGGRGAVFMVDLDRFKEVNDTLGHEAGDALLKEFGSRLRQALRASDTVARLGGDEFGVLVRDCDPAHVVPVVEKITAAVERPVVLGDAPIGIEASIGVALYPNHGETVDTLIRHADEAMYRAKDERSCYALYDGSFDAHHPARLAVVGELRRAIDQRELFLAYQPKAVLESGDVGGVEALVRWAHPERGVIPPDEFISLAEQTSLIKPLTLYVLDEALRQGMCWLEQGLRLSIAVNLSTRNLLDVEFPSDVAALIAKWRFPPALLELEITESTVLADPFRTRTVLGELSAMGIRLSIDDFGTGYSSLAYLKSLPVNEIKIDRSFVMSMLEDKDDAVIVRSTIDLGRNLGLEVVAEGVESEEIWDELSSLGCDIAQGYHLSRPLPPDELGAWLLGRRADERRAA